MKKFNFTLDEINSLTMLQFRKYYAAITKEEISAYQYNISANLLGARGSEEHVTQALKRD